MLYLRDKYKILQVADLTDEELTEITRETYEEKRTRTSNKLATKVYPQPTALEFGYAMFVGASLGADMYEKRTGLEKIICMQIMMISIDNVNKALLEERFGTQA